MAQNDMLKRYLDAGVAFTQMTRARAEGIVKELVKAGEVQRDQMQSQVDDLIERSRRNTEELVVMVRREVAAQYSQLGVATRADLESLAERLGIPLGRSTRRQTPGGSGAAPSSTKKAPSAKKVAKHIATKRGTPTAGTAGPAKKAATKKAPAKALVAGATPAKKAPAKKVAAKKAGANKVPAATVASTPTKKAAAKRVPTTKAAVVPARTATASMTPAPLVTPAPTAPGSES